MSSVVEKLSQGRHPVSMTRYPTAAELRGAIDRGFVLAKFTGTLGGTELGFKIDAAQSRIEASESSPTLHLVGQLNLDYTPVQCEVDVDPEAREGWGKLTILTPETAGSA